MEISSKELARRIRISSLKMVAKAKASHIGGALSIADILAVLYGNVLNIDPLMPLAPGRDRFILSKGHACTAVYAVLGELGFFPIDDLSTYGDNFSIFMNHISHKVPGVEFSTGSLGHGLPFGVGKAFFAKKRQLSFRTYVLLSDGELDEGSNWEAIMFAAHHQLDNLTIIIDYNKLQSLSLVKDTIGLEPLTDKFKAFGADVFEVNGHDHDEILKVLGAGGSRKPRVIVAHTIKGKGVSFMEGEILWHYRSPSEDELKKAIEEVGLSNA